MSLPEFEKLRFTGPVSVRPVAGKLPYNSFRCMIMGPTGAGKSSFIEALGGESHGLKISANQLASVTQNVAAYELINVRRNDWPVYIVDTPGFSDSKLSEREIVGMVEAWSKDNGYVDAFLFLIPINVTRIEGTKRRTMKMMSKLLKGELRGLIFVTTMWDQLATESVQQRADSNFTQLEKEILKEYIDDGAELTKFENKQSSALEALDKVYNWISDFVSPPDVLYLDLHERICMALQEKQMIEEQLTNPNNSDILELKELLDKNHAENEDILVKFIGQLRQYNQPPEHYEEAYARISAQIVALGDKLEIMEDRSRERVLASGHEPQHEVPVLGDYRRRLQQELEVYQQELEQQYERELEQKLIRESKFTFRIKRKMRKVGSSITNKLKPTSGHP